MQKYVVKDAAFDRGVVIGTLYFGVPYLENRQIFFLFLEEAYCCSRTKQLSKYGPPKYRVPITAPLSKTAPLTPMSNTLSGTDFQPFGKGKKKKKTPPPPIMGNHQNPSQS